jgi:hypothetical protein
LINYNKNFARRGKNMALPKNPDEKFDAVRSAYLAQIIPSIKLVYEKANQVRESFILVHCAILSLSGFNSGSRDTTGATYRKFIADFFPMGYDPDKLWRDLRNHLIHAYTITRSYVLAHKHPEKHLSVEKNIKSELTGIPTDLTYLNFENFLDEFEKSAISYFQKAKSDPDLMTKLSNRYDVAPPAIYFTDKEIAAYSKKSRH